TAQYTVSDPGLFLFQTAAVDRLVASAATAAISEALSAEPVDGVLTVGKQRLGVRLAELLQKTVDGYRLGIVIRSVDIAAIEPPAEVADAFDQVVSALRERERAVHQAESYANKTAAEARGGAQRLLDEGQAERDRTIRLAQGEAERFESLLANYERSPKLTAGRLYLDALAQTLPKLRTKLIVDSSSDVDVSILREDAR
ncbi:MAG TPA: protease modulator HflK, partial [Pirellulales bacterium]|nr:protease modulator HflK [Pirellulales bacterium]